MPEMHVATWKRSEVPAFRVFATDRGWVVGFAEIVVKEWRPVVRVWWHGKHYVTMEEAEAYLYDLVEKGIVSCVEKPCSRGEAA